MKDCKLNFYTCFLYMIQYMNNLRIEYCMFYFGWLFDTVIGIVAPILFGVMIDQIVYYKNINLFIKSGLLFFFVSVFSCILYYFLYDLYGQIWNSFHSQFRTKMFKHMQKIDAEVMTHSSYGDIVNMIQFLPAECVNFMVRNVVHTVNYCILIVACMVILFIINPIIGLLMIVLVPISVVIMRKSGNKIRSESLEYRKAQGEYTSWIFEILNTLKDINLLNAENMVERKFRHNSSQLFKMDFNTKKETIKAEQTISVVNVCLQMILYLVLAFLAAKHIMSIGLVVVVLTYFMKLTQGVSQLCNYFMDGQKRIAVVQKIYDFLETDSTDLWKGTKLMLDVKGNIEIKDLVYAYKDKSNILDCMNLHIAAGEKLAIVGESGCGKTTLAYILMGFYSKKSGQVLVDSIPIEEYSLQTLYENIGFVQQDIVVFSGTIRENLLMAKRDANEEDLIFACKAAGIYDFIQETEQGFDTLLGHNGSNLSGGQRQRLAIARVYLKNPNIIIFDEATSALDVSTEKAVHDAWRQILCNKTVIVIAHRLSSVLMCDKVAILKNGKIVEMGKTEEMFKHSQNFKKMFAIE